MQGYYKEEAMTAECYTEDGSLEPVTGVSAKPMAC